MANQKREEDELELQDGSPASQDNTIMRLTGPDPQPDPGVAAAVQIPTEGAVGQDAFPPDAIEPSTDPIQMPTGGADPATALSSDQVAAISAIGAGPQVEAPTLGVQAPSLDTPAMQTAGEQSEVQAALEAAVLDMMQNPSRYDSSVVQAGMDVIESSLASMREEGYRGLGEHYADRGLLGSTIESGGMVRYESDLQQIAAQQAAALLREQALAYGQDQSTALNAALGVSGQEIQREAMESDRNFQQMQLDLQREGLEKEDAYRYAALEWQRQYGTAQLGLQEQDLALQRQQMEQDSRFQTRALDLQEQGMNQDQAYRIAALEWEKEFGTQQLGLQAQEMAQNYALSKEELQVRREQMAQDARYQQQVLSLQKQGMDQTQSYRMAQLQWEQDYGMANLELARDEMENNAFFKQEQVRLEEEGMAKDEAYRQAQLAWEREYGLENLSIARESMESDQTFQQERLRLQEEGMDADEAYRQAALAWEKEYGTMQLDLQQQNLDQGQMLNDINLLNAMVNAYGPSVLEGLDLSQLFGGGNIDIQSLLEGRVPIGTDTTNPPNTDFGLTGGGDPLDEDDEQLDEDYW